jgi:hypothetical protein
LRIRNRLVRWRFCSGQEIFGGYGSTRTKETVLHEGEK